MARTRHGAPERVILLVMVALLLAASVLAGEPLRDAPVAWYADDACPIEIPAYEEPGLVPFGTQAFVAGPISRFFHPGRLVRRLDDGYPGRPAQDINALGEVLDSSWFTNRVGLFPVTPEEVAFGPGQPEGPDRSQPWTIIGAKVGGVTPGFRIKDGAGDTWLLKFDPPAYPGMSTRSGVVANLLFHLLGYYTPVDRVVFFQLDDLVPGEGATMRLPRFGEVPLTEANLDSVLQASNAWDGEQFVGLASKFLSGKPLGPYKSQGTREDDANDTIDHENRRSLRAMKVFAAWLNHFDTKMHNSLDVYVGDPGDGHVRHHLIDFASTLGSFGAEPVKRFGYEFGVDVPSVFGRLLTLGLVEDSWIYLERPAGLDEVGFFDVETFDPASWEPDIPHSGQAELAREDGYWAAKALSAVKEEHLRAAVEQGRYRNPDAVDFLVETLRGRQEKIVRYWFAKVPPLDFFRLQGEAVHYRDLGVEHGFLPAAGCRYRHRLAIVDADRDADRWTDWLETRTTTVRLADAPRVDERRPFLALQVQVDRGQGWSDTITAYLAPGSGRIVAVDR